MPGTCCVGFNSIRFDDEFTRNLLYRNFYDPYAREWENKNSRWDVIDLARMCYALRPEGIEWPMRKVEECAQGRALLDPRAQDARKSNIPSFRLEDLTAANNLAHRHAHDALSDVQATIASNEKLAREFGAVPMTPIESGVERFVAWYRSYYRTPQRALS